MSLTAAPTRPAPACTTASYAARRWWACGRWSACARIAPTPTGRPNCSATWSIVTSGPRSTARAYRIDSFEVELIAHQRGTAFVRAVCSVSVRPAASTLAARPLRGIVEELLLAPARARATSGRLVDVAVVPAP